MNPQELPTWLYSKFQCSVYSFHYSFRYSLIPILLVQPHGLMSFLLRVIDNIIVYNSFKLDPLVVHVTMLMQWLMYLLMHDTEK